MRGAALVALLIAGSVGATAVAQPGTLSPSPGGVTGDAGPDRDLGTGAAGALGQGNRLGTGGGVTGDAQTRPTIDDPAFLRLDTNRSGTLDRAEAEFDAGLARDFAAADANRDGSLSLSEFQGSRR